MYRALCEPHLQNKGSGSCRCDSKLHLHLAYVQPATRAPPVSLQGVLNDDLRNTAVIRLFGRGMSAPAPSNYPVILVGSAFVLGWVLVPLDVSRGADLKILFASGLLV